MTRLWPSFLNRQQKGLEKKKKIVMEMSKNKIGQNPIFELEKQRNLSGAMN